MRRCSNVIPGLDDRPEKCSVTKGSRALPPPRDNNFFYTGATLHRDEIPHPPSALSALAAQFPEPPEEFDWRDQDGLKLHFSGNVVAQGKCGSCWAVAAAGALGDRYAVALNKRKRKIKKPIRVSAIELLSCFCAASGGQMPSGQICSGGNIQQALNFMVNNKQGVSSEMCFPYPQQLMNSKKAGAEFSGQKTPTISWKANSEGDGNLGCMFGVTGCQSGKICNEDKIKFSIIPGSLSTWANPGSVSALKREIMANGPVPTSFKLSQDFVSWWKNAGEKDVYNGNPGNLGHAVVIVGWTKNAWIIRNSWGKSHDNSWYGLIDINNKLGVGFGLNGMGGAVAFMPTINDTILDALSSNGYIGDSGSGGGDGGGGDGGGGFFKRFADFLKRIFEPKENFTRSGEEDKRIKNIGIVLPVLIVLVLGLLWKAKPSWYWVLLGLAAYPILRLVAIFVFFVIMGGSGQHFF